MTNAGPGVAGWLRPVIFRPSATLAGLAPEQLETIVAHEQTRLRRESLAAAAELRASRLFSLLEEAIESGLAVPAP